MSSIRLKTTGGAGESFTTIQVPSGTSPVATGPNDTLTLAAGSGISIVGDSSSDTVTISSTGGTPAGSDKQIQFNDGGAFGADSNLIFDKTTDALGVQVASPQAAVHVASITGQGIADVTSASVTQIAETIDASPTGAVTPIAEFATPGSISLSQDFGGSGFIDSNQTLSYEVYPVLYDGTTYYTSSNFVSDGFTAGSSGNPFSVTITLPSPVAEQTHWLIKRQVDGGGFNDSILVSSAVNPYSDEGFTGIASNAGWPNLYTFTYTVPLAPSGLTPQAVNIGSGSLTADGKTYLIEARGATQYNGVYYCEQTGDSTSYADPNDSSTFDLETLFTFNGGTETVFRISIDSGSTWEYFFGGTSGSFTYSGQANDAVAEAAWSDDYTSISQSWSFKAFGVTNTPVGGQVYASTATTYYGTITTPDVNYIFKHEFTGIPSAGCKVLGDYETSVTNGRLVSTSPMLDGGYTSWASGTSVTPNHYGFTGTDQNIEYRLYGFNGTLLIYSATAYVLNTTDTGGYKYNSVSFSYPSGVTTVKVLKFVNGSGTSIGSQSFNSPTASFSDAALSTWSGTTTITPTITTPATSRFDATRGTEADADCVQVIALGASGTRIPSIGFGVAASTSASPSIVSRISAASATGNVNIGATRVDGFTNAGMGTPTWRLGSSYDFNINASTTAHMTIFGATSALALAYFYSVGDSNRGTVYFGQSTTSFGTGAKVVIAPSNNSTTSLYLRGATGANSDAILIDEGGSFRGAWHKDGRMAVGATAVAANVQLLIGATTGRAQIRFNDGSGGAGSPTAGDLWRSGGQLLFRNASSQSVTLLGVLTATATLDFPSIGANDTAQLTMTVTGAATGDAVFIGLPSTINTGLVATGFVSATNTVAIRLHNTSGGSIDPASSTFRAVVAKL